MPNLTKLPTWADKTHINAVVETPRGSHCKLEFDPKHRAFTLAKPLLAGLTYPYDWGFVPSTQAEDRRSSRHSCDPRCRVLSRLNSPLQADRGARSCSDHQAWERRDRPNFRGAGPVTFSGRFAGRAASSTTRSR